MGRAMTEDRIKALTIEWCPHKSSHSPGVPTLCAWCCTTFALLRTAIAEATAAKDAEIDTYRKAYDHVDSALNYVKEKRNALQERLNRTADERDAALAECERLRVFICGVVDVRDECREVLRSVEWPIIGVKGEQCVCCGRYKADGHEANCRLAAALREQAAPADPEAMRTRSA